MKKLQEAILILFLLLLALLPRLYQLDQKSLWMDEIGQITAAREGPLAAIRGAKNHVAAMPVDYLITFIVTRFGNSDFVVRIPPAIWGTLSVILIYELGKKVYDSKLVGVAAGILLAISPMSIYYSQEARFYSLFTLFSILSGLFFYKVIYDQKPISWILLFISLTISTYTHFYTGFVIISIWIFSFINAVYLLRTGQISLQGTTRYFKNLVIMSISVLILVVPWILFAGLGRESVFNFQMPEIFRIVAVPIIGFGGYADILGLFIFPLLAIVGLILGIRDKRIFALFFGLMILIAISGILLTDFLFSYFYSPRQLLFVAPYYMLLIASGIYFSARESTRFFSLNDIRERVLIILITATGLVIIALGLRTQLMSYYETQKSINWRDMAAMISWNIGDEDREFFSDSPRHINLKRNIFYYQPGLEDYYQPDTILDNLSSNQRVWLVSTPDNVNKFLSSGELTAIPLQFDHFNRYNLYYIGKVERSKLLDELIEKDFVESLLGNSNILYEINSQDAERAEELIIDGLIQYNSRAPKSTALDHAKFLTIAARIQSDAGNQELAIEYISEALQVNTRNVNIISNAGYIHLKNRDCEKAVDYFKKTTTFYPDFYWGYYFLGTSYECLQNWNAAIEAYDLAFEIQREPRVLFRKAKVLQQIGESESTIDVLNRIMDEFSDEKIISEVSDLLEEIK